MKGLLLKDLMMMLKYGRLTLLACLIFSLVGWFGEPNLFMMLYPVIIGSVMAQSLISYDERSGWDRYCDALPVSRAQVVTGKYLIALLVFAVCGDHAGIVAGLVILGFGRPCIQKTVCGHGNCRTGFTAARLIDEIRSVAIAEEHLCPAIPSVRGGHPAHAALAIAMKINDRIAVILSGSHEQHIGVIDVSRIAGTRSIHPVRCRVKFTFNGLGDCTARGKHPDFR